mgnify:CR=1 FL=1
MELHEAIDEVMEGGQALGVSCEDVYRRMMCNEKLMLAVMQDIHSEEELVFYDFFSAFTTYAESMLKEALRAKQEVDAGCL